MRYLAFIALMLVYAQKRNQSPTATSAPPARDTLVSKIYQQTLRYKDPFVRLYALHQRIALEGASFALRDTLAQAYFEAGMYPQVIAVAEELLSEDPKNATLAELRALAYFYLQDAKKALDAYEKLYEITQEPLHLYQVISLQFNLQRYGECQANIDRVLSQPESAQTQVRITLPDGRVQAVPVRAAALNVRGVLLRLQKEYKKAQEAFEEALKIAPDFLLAKGNLEDLQKELSASATQGSKK